MCDNKAIALAIISGSNYYAPEGSQYPVKFDARRMLKNPAIKQLVKQATK